jgi:hypothetical protein
LAIAPWVSWFGLGDWGDNFFLVFAAQKTGFQNLQQAVASGWVRGAVSGVGLLNIGIAFWELFNFKRTVAALQQQTSSPRRPAHNAAPTSTADYLRDHERSSDSPNNS